MTFGPYFRQHYHSTSQVVGEQKVRRLGPFIVNHNTAGVEDWDDAPGVKIADIGADTTVIAAWAVPTIQFTGGGGGFMDLYLGTDEGDFAEIIRYQLTGTSQTADTPVLSEFVFPMSQPIAFPVSQTSNTGVSTFAEAQYAQVVLNHRITMAQEAAGLRVYIIRNAGAFSAGQVHVYALIAEPA